MLCPQVWHKSILQEISHSNRDEWTEWGPGMKGLFWSLNQSQEGQSWEIHLKPFYWHYTRNSLMFGGCFSSHSRASLFSFGEHLMIVLKDSSGLPRRSPQNFNIPYAPFLCHWGSHSWGQAGIQNPCLYLGLHSFWASVSSSVTWASSEPSACYSQSSPNGNHWYCYSAYIY